MSTFRRRDNETEEEFEERQRVGTDTDEPVDPNIEHPEQSPTTLDNPNPNFVPPDPHPTEVVPPGTEPEEVVEPQERLGTEEEDENERRN